MQVVTADETHRLLDYPGLVEALRELFRRGVDQVERELISQPLPDGGRNDWLILPAWQYGRHQGIKLVSVFPGNEARGIASVQGLYLLFDGTNGLPLLCVDGAALTLRKTAANSALAASFLARRDSSTLLMVGAGAMAPHLIAAHAAVRPIRRVLIWNRTAARAEALARDLDLPKVKASVVGDLAAAVGEADVISAATMSRDPLILGAWLKPGQHLDLVGGYREDMREADDAAVRPLAHLRRRALHRRRPCRRHLPAAGRRADRRCRHHRHFPARPRRKAGPPERGGDHALQIRRRRA